MSHTLYDAALAAFVDDYLESHPDADEFEAERAFEEASDDIVTALCADITCRIWQKEKDRRHENI